MSLLRKLSKSALFLAPVGGFGYYVTSNKSENEDKLIPAFQSSPSTFFDKYRKEHNLITPVIYENYQTKYPFDHFFERTILKDLEGLIHYNLYIDKDHHDVMIDEKDMSLEQKKEINSKAKLHCTFVADSTLQGHNGIIHGGFTSTLFDNVAGYLAFISADLTPALTAYLNMTYKKPLKTNTEYIAVIEVDKIEGRKFFLKGKIIDQHNNVYSTMETLYIRMKWDYDYIKYLYKALLLDTSSSKIQKASQIMPVSNTLSN